MRVRVLFFGVLKDLAGQSAEEAEFPEGSKLGAVLERYARRFPPIGQMAGSILLAQNQQFAPLSAELEEGAEVALLPPVSGGAGAGALEVRDNGSYFALTRRTIRTREIVERLLTGAEGAVVTFEGTARNHTGERRTRCLTYEAYEPMALQELARIGRDVASRAGIGRVAIVHRLGRVLIGEVSVAIIVTAPHRKPAFGAAMEAIDRIKKTVPIWKKEHFADGEVWVEGEWSERGLAAD